MPITLRSLPPIIAAMAVSAMTYAATPAGAQVQPEAYSYPVGFDPYGDNFLALRSLPSATEGVRLARLGPNTLFAEIGRTDGWVRVRLASGETGWVSARYVGCCRTAMAAPEVQPAPVASSCDDLWYERNALYKAAGYCFRSPRGIQTFGNAGCQYDDEADVPLSARQREQANRIRSAERRMGCAP